MRAISSGDEAAPPMWISVQAGRDRTLPRSGELSSALAMVGTSDIEVALLFLDQAEHAGGLEAPHHHLLQPVMVADCGRPQPLAWNSGMVCSSTRVSSW